MKKIVFTLALICFARVQGIQARLSGSPEVYKPRQNNAFTEGEILTYRLHYGLIEAGIATLEVKNEAREFGGRPSYHVVGLGKSTGAFDWFFKVRDRYESFIDRESLVPMVFLRHVDEGGYKINQTHIYNHYKKEVLSNGKTFTVPEDAQDMISAFYFARNLDFTDAKPGKVYTINSFVDDEVFPLQIKFVAKENLETDLGTFRCLKFRPVIQKGRIFENEEDLNVWISDDLNHIPIRAQAEILVGSIKMDLLKYSGLNNKPALQSKN